MRKLFFGLVVAGINGLAGLPVIGQSPDTLVLDEVVVSGNRVEVMKSRAPLSVSVVSGDEIQQHEASNILPVVSMMTPNMFVSEIGVAGYPLGNSTAGQINIRGISGAPNARILMMVDGQPQYMGIFGHPLPNFHVASNVDKVEVVRGPGSLLYGSNAMGGIINVITKKDHQDGVSGQVHASYGSYNTQKYSGSVNVNHNKLTARVSFNYDKTDGHRDTSAFNNSNFNVKLGYRVNDHWKAEANYMMADYSFEDPGRENDPESIAFTGDITRNMATLALKNSYERVDGGLHAFYNWGEHAFSDGWRSTDVNTGANLYQGLTLWKGGLLTAGIDFKHYGGTGSTGFLADTLLTVQETAGYLLLDQSFGEIVNLNAGVRYEYHSVYGGELVPQAGFSVRPMKGTTIKGLLSKGFRSPTIMELYLFAPNSALEPERLVNYELSVSQQFGSSVYAEITGFIINGTNLIQIQPNPTPPPPVTRVNAGEFSNKGLEIESSVKLSSNFTGNVSYSLLDTETSLLFAPSQQLYIGGAYQLGKIHFSLNYKRVQDLTISIDNENPENNVSESYGLLNAKVTYRPLDFLQVYLAGKNLTDNSYNNLLGYPMPGIRFMTGISFYLK